MTTDAESKAMTLKEQLEQGEYQVDTKKVADAILRNPMWLALLAGVRPCPSGSRPALS
jgi:anti-sigma-28 factor FlgM